MIKEVYHKYRHHPLFMVGLCLVPILAVLGIFFLFKSSANGWVWLLILLCPLSHVFMMRGHGHDDHEQKADKNNIKKINKIIDFERR